MECPVSGYFGYQLDLAGHFSVCRFNSEFMLIALVSFTLIVNSDVWCLLTFSSDALFIALLELLECATQASMRN